MANQPSYLPLVILIVVVLAGAGASAGYLYYKTQPAPSSGLRLVQLGDNATVTYVGILGSGPEQGKVFDTSVYQVAKNNASWPKALQFGFRGGASSYTQLGVHVGSIARANYTLNNYSFVQVVPGFWQGLLGIPTNVTHSVIVPPALGYAHFACSVVLPLKFQLPVFQTLRGQVFQKLYPGILATTGATFADPHYGWTVQILSANATSVSLQNLPQVGATSKAGSWLVQVTNITSTPNGTGAITLQNELSSTDAGHLQGTSSTGVSCGGQPSTRYIVTAVNLTAGTYTEDFNQEVAGQTLIFLVKVVDLFPPSVPATTAR